YIPDLVPGLTNSVLALLERIRHTLSDRILQGVEHLVTNKHPHPVNVVLNVAPSSLNNRLQELELRGKMSVDPFNNGLENVLLDKRPRDVNVVPDLRPNQFNNSLEELEPRYQLVVHKVHNRSENVLLNELPRRVNGNADTLPNHLNDGPEQLEHWRKIILHKRNDSVEDDLNALPPSRDNQLNTVKHRYRNVLPQPTEHGTNSIKHSLNDRQHVSLEPCSDSLNRKHDPRPNELDTVPQPFSASHNAIPNSLHHRPHILHEPIRHGQRSRFNAGPSGVHHVTEPANLLVRHNKGTNKKDKARNNQTNRVGSHHSIKGRLRRRHTVSDSDTRRPQDQVPLLNQVSRPRQPITDNTNSIPGNHRTNNRRNHRCPVLEDFPRATSRSANGFKNSWQLLNALNNRIRDRPHHGCQLLQKRNHRLANGNLNVVLSDLERLTESLSNVLASLSLRRSKLTSAVLHHIENIINTDFALRCHLLNNVTSGAELRGQRINDRITRLGNHRQRVIHNDTTVVDTLQEAVHGPVKLRSAATGTNDCPTNLVEHLN